MRKRVYFQEIIFTNEYYIDGINIFDEHNVEFIKHIDIDLKLNVSFSKIDKAKLYSIKGLNVKFVIAEVKDFKIICYLKPIMFARICNHPRHIESAIKNYSLLEEYVINKIKNLSTDNVLYSDDYKTRAYISNENNTISLKYQTLEIYDEDYYLFESVTSDNFWVWEDLPGISYFDSIDSAKQEAKIYLKNPILEPNTYYDKPYVSLWEFQLSRVQTVLYMMKFVMIGPIVIMLLSCLLPLFGQSNWNILWLTGGCCLFTLVLAGILMWKNYNPISYEISDKGIIACKGMCFETTFDNIKKIRIKKNLFNKNRGSIKFKLYKGLSVNYNFDNIDNVDEAYNIIKKNMINE